MKPTRSILSPAFKYVNAANTDIARTFAKVRWEMARAGKRQRVLNVGTLVVGRVDAVKPLRRIA